MTTTPIDPSAEQPTTPEEQAALEEQRGKINGHDCIAKLARLSRIEYDQVRNGIAKDMEIRVSTLDAEVATARGGSSGDDLPGERLQIKNVEPSPEPVDGAALLDELSVTFARYLVLPTHAPEVLALWTVHTHTFDVVEATPYLAITAPTHECGKSRVLDVLQPLCRRSYRNTNISPAALYRVIDRHAPTLLIDEFETFMKKDDLRGILNAGYTRAGAFVPRCVGEDHEVRNFSVWAPKVFVLIGKLPATLRSRSIEIPMQRRLRTECIERLRYRTQQQLGVTLTPKCVRWAQDNMKQIRDAQPDLPNDLGDRHQDIWEPLLAIADIAGGDWPKKARDAALALVGDDIVAESTSALLLSDLRDLFLQRNTDRLASTEIVQVLGAMDERPWSELGKLQKPITKIQLANRLRPFGIVSGTKRDGKETFKGYYFKQFKDVFARYLPASDPSQRHNPTTTPRPEESGAVTEANRVTDQETPKPAPDKGCDVVTDRNPLPWKATI